MTDGTTLSQQKSQQHSFAQTVIQVNPLVADGVSRQVQMVHTNVLIAYRPSQNQCNNN